MRAGRHERGTDGLRPVHPACGALDGRGCTCEQNWNYWDGSRPALDREVQVSTRLDNQTRVAFHALRGRGVGPDGDDGDERFGSVEPVFAPLADDDDFMPLSDVETLPREELVTDGFWRESEFLKQFQD